MNGQFTNDWLQGYLTALANIEFATKDFMDQAKDTERSAIEGYRDVIFYIGTVRQSYRKLVEELNEKSKV